MKILQLMSGPLASGAGRGALALDRGLRARGVETRILGRLEADPPADVTAVRFDALTWLATGIANRVYLRRLRRRFGTPEVLFHPISHGYRPDRHPVFGWADLVHVQWAQAAMLGPGFFRVLPGLAKPIIFSLRDMWLMTGGCHYAGACTGFTADCAGCPLLAGDSDSVTRADLTFKARWLAGADAFVAISAHVAALARRSAVLGDADVRVIPNSIDAARFAPADKSAMRRRLGLPDGKFIVGFGALHLSEARKGGPMMARIMAEMAGDDGLHWAVFGADPPALPGNATWLGRVSDDAQLNAVYAACDLFVMPSLQETFGKMTAEALAAGTPVLAFRDTPADEIVQHGDSGWLVPLGDVAALARGIEAVRALSDEARTAAGMAGRRHVLASYAPDVVADAHLRLYAEKIEARRRAAR